MEDLGSLLPRVPFLFLFNAIEALYEKKKKRIVNGVTTCRWYTTKTQKKAAALLLSSVFPEREREMAHVKPDVKDFSRSFDDKAS